LVSWLIVALVLIAIPLAVAATLLTAALPLGLLWLANAGLLQPILRTEEALIGLSVAPRMMLFACWLFMVAAGAVALTRGWGILRGWSGIRGTDSVVWGLLTSVSSVLIAI